MRWLQNPKIRSLLYNLLYNFSQDDHMTAVTSREVIHNFSAVAARVAAGEELTVTRYGKPVLRLVRIDPGGLSAREREALVGKALSFRMTRPYGKQFERCDAYDF